MRTGDVHEVRERAGSRQVKVGELYFARVVPAGETMQIFGGIEPVAVGERDDLIALLDDDPDPVELVALLSRRFAPPVLQNTEGESLVMCNATLRVGDPAGLAEVLDDAYDRGDGEPDGTRVRFEHVVTHGMQRIRAHLELSGDQLHVHANSEARFERVLATIRALDLSVSVLSQTREPAGDVRAVGRLATRNSATPATFLDPASDPAIAAALDEMARNYEAAWLDEPILALAGHTPRECADDPTRRPDLIRLLDSFPQDTGAPGTGSPTGLPGPELTLLPSLARASNHGQNSWARWLQHLSPHCRKQRIRIRQITGNNRYHTVAQCDSSAPEVPMSFKGRAGSRRAGKRGYPRRPTRQPRRRGSSHTLVYTMCMMGVCRGPILISMTSSSPR
ncbi:hypothetical protein [Candidatus Mycolicibacterium alkanivorans]|uniref:Uncharacterized protein n=1 Tax=Candidatus Mycolicibacterium alkanivorans TaxID=2954114 RepID=A0ABS9YS82_9MYCO|nr:hypothetical protein [Candidatus Mycolicibacterium alkanivorans]MCI4674091.1 hypothetical protein [Candidatus Mycolicibacterium alkanivorans]